MEVDFTRCSIADQPELREEICERLTPIKEYTFHVNEEAPIQHYFSSVSVSVEDLSPGIYRINVTTMRIWTENGENIVPALPNRIRIGIAMIQSN